MSLLGKVAANGPGYIRTGAFKRRVAREDRAVDRGGPAAELPVEADARRTRKPLCLEDLRLALQLGDGYLSQTPLIAGGIWNSRVLDTEGIQLLYADDDDDAAPPEKKMKIANGVDKPAGQTWRVECTGGDAMLLDEDSWAGGGVADTRDLDGVLDDVLSLAEL
tara:strand:+ start:45452 stop:45943 length:492 start_codon:yes stop_codon:yes gene_type:complete